MHLLHVELSADAMSDETCVRVLQRNDVGRRVQPSLTTQQSESLNALDRIDRVLARLGARLVTAATSNASGNNDKKRKGVSLHI